MTLAPESIITCYRNEMDPQVNQTDNSTSNETETPKITWQSLPQNPETLPEMQELIPLFQQAAEELRQIKMLTFDLSESLEEEWRTVWLNSSEVLKILRISKRTLQEYRDKRRIGFAKFGGKMYYSKRVVMALLNKAKV